MIVVDASALVAIGLPESDKLRVSLGLVARPAQPEDQCVWLSPV